MTVFAADVVLVDGAFRRGHAVAVGTDGRIERVGPAAALDPDGRAERFTGSAILPGHVSAHSHCFQVLLRGRRPEPRDFVDWVTRLLYPLVRQLDERALRAAAALAFSEMARAGITTVGEFHYVHNGPDGKPAGGDPNRLAAAVVETAREVGLRIALLRTCYDASSRAGQERFAETPAAAGRAVVDLARRFAGEAGVSVLPAPHSLHGASDTMIRAAVGAAEELDSRYHIHLAEQPGDPAFARQRYGTTPLRALQKLDVLSHRTVLVHGLYLDDEERRALADAGGALVVNPTTNSLLGDGVTDLEAVLRAGIPLALGTDADQAPSLFDEMREIEYAARGAARAMGVAERAAGGGEDAAAASAGARLLLEAASRGGAAALGLDTGRLAPGESADFTVIDLTDTSLAPVGLAWTGDGAGSEPTLDLGAAIVHGLSRTAVRHVYVDGRPIVRDGEVVTVPRAALAERLRAAGLAGR